jgi:transposase
MKIMHTMANETIAQRPKRRNYSTELKGHIVAECQVSGPSVAGVALAHGVNANIVHRWMREQADALLTAPRNEFVALNLPPPVEQVPATETRVHRRDHRARWRLRVRVGQTGLRWFRRTFS